MLHIICESCGTYLNRENSVVSVERDYKGQLEDVTITCDNCGEVHSLSEVTEVLD